MIQWGPKYTLGIPKVDVQHQILVTLINRLEFLRAGQMRSDRDVEEILKHLEQYIRTHFADEERMFESVGYDESETHKAEHRNFENQVENFRLAFSAGDPEIVEHLASFLGGWLRHHILENDRRYVDYFREHGSLERARAL